MQAALLVGSLATFPSRCKRYSFRSLYYEWKLPAPDAPPIETSVRLK
jgi:hypothetical protein